MSIHSIKESFEEVPTKANSALDSQIAYYKLFIFRFISKSSYALVTFFIVAFAIAYAVGEALGSNALGFAIVGAFYILIAIMVLAFRKKLIERPLLEKLSEIYFKVEPDDEE